MITAFYKVNELSKDDQRNNSFKNDENKSQDGDKSISVEVDKNTVSLSLGFNSLFLFL